MISTKTYMNCNWVDLNSPTTEEIDSVVLSYGVNAKIAKDLSSPTPKQEVVDYGNFLYVVIHLPVFKHSRREAFEQEVDFAISGKNLITTRYESIDAIHHFTKKIEVNSILNRDEYFNLFSEMIREIYLFLNNELSYIEDWTKEIEKNIFSGKEKDMVFAISSVGRNLLNFKRTIHPHGEVFENIKNIGAVKFGESFAKDMDTIIHEWKRMIYKLNNQIELTNQIRETNNSLLNTKQNEIMKNLTIIAFIGFPLSVIAAIFGMNTKNLPIVGLEGDFWIVIGIMLISIITTTLFFKIKKWM